MKNTSNWLVGFLLPMIFAVLLAGCASTSTRESTGQFIDDSVITTNVKTAIYSDPEYKVGQISVKTYKGVVQLSGFVNTSAAATKAVKLASAVKGVVSIENSLVLK